MKTLSSQLRHMVHPSYDIRLLKYWNSQKDAMNGGTTPQAQRNAPGESCSASLKSERHKWKLKGPFCSSGMSHRTNEEVSRREGTPQGTRRGKKTEGCFCSVICKLQNDARPKVSAQQSTETQAESKPLSARSEERGLPLAIRHVPTAQPQLPLAKGECWSFPAVSMLLCSKHQESQTHAQKLG